ncbi:MAG: 16S rRNA (guanine(527)-N(7))-methyltransferase RsmG [Solirubrobacterales bacterium]|nr:16S rRNA (guanine(527)-N(7))-methyltransferase RsmG [Solirubrobacterales bacterium]
MSPAPPDPAEPWRDRESIARLDPMLEMLASSHVSLSSVTDPAEARRVHVADSLSGLACEEVSQARRVIDLGAGGGFPGVPLAVAMPGSDFTLIDSVGRKVEFVNEVISALGLDNARAIKGRSEEWAGGEGREAYDLVTARAVAPLSVLAELSSPLLEEGGHLVAWKGEPEPEELKVIAAHADRLAMESVREVSVKPFEGSRERRFYVLRKVGPTPEGLPRRPGMARKRPLAGR